MFWFVDPGGIYGNAQNLIINWYFDIVILAASMEIHKTITFQTYDGQLWLKTLETWANTEIVQASTRGFQNVETSGSYTSVTNTLECLMMKRKRPLPITITPKNTLECLQNSITLIENHLNLCTYTFLSISNKKILVLNLGSGESNVQNLVTV